MHRYRWLERALIAVGVWLLAWVWIDSLQAESFRRQLEASALTPVSDAEPSPTRSAYVGRLEIPRLNVLDIVAEGDGDVVLDAAIGHLSDTPLPWEPGNSVLAGHRDRGFRPLKDVRVGDLVRLVTLRKHFDYLVTETLIVRPDETWVLDPTPTRTLTLITCYPFSYVGPAPARFVVKAEAIGSAETRDLDPVPAGGLGLIDRKR